ncbi:MAG: hypothetical protein N4A33_07825 [Bacteriovoracaceae bacterium]|jgi:hypothetical protein|nr:hypothetical protein [Bacteriovoracaceae bacterium]
MKRILIVLFTLNLISSLFAQESFNGEELKVEASYLQEPMQAFGVKKKRKTVKNCESGYRWTRQYIAYFHHPDFMEAVGAGTVGLFVGAFTLFNPSGILLAVPFATSSLIFKMREKSYTKAEKVFIASRLCSENSCNYHSLNNLRTWLEKKGLYLSNNEIANIVDSDARKMDLCIERVKKNNVVKMKSYKKLRKAILERAEYI